MSWAETIKTIEDVNADIDKVAEEILAFTREYLGDEVSEE